MNLPIHVPNIAPKPQLIPLSVATQIIPLSDRHLRTLCERGEFKTACKPGSERGHWYIDRSEVVARIAQSSNSA